MEKQLFQWSFIIKGLLPSEVKLRRKIWLKKDELLLDKKGDKLYAYLLDDESNSFNKHEKITPYLKVASLVSGNSTDIEGGGGVSIKSKKELGTKPVYSGSISIGIPEDAVDDIERYANRFIGFIGKLHDKYISVISENAFIELAIDYFYDAEKKFVYSDEGFISAMISMEALFNEGPSDIKYKLSHRAAFLLSLCGEDPIESFEKLKDFYNKRSKLVHGVGNPPYDPDSHLISKYTRRTIIIFLILLKNEERRKIGKNKRKINILKEVDYAMLDGSRRKLLEKEIKKGLKDFSLPIPRTFEGKGKNGDYRITAW